ncbi:MAG: RNA-directed DNA polymerase [Candidatus Azotimanducaceae bacterium]|jgi:RNA-directed DNA polymerase
MDDILILTKRRWHNRKAIKALSQILNKLKVEKHPDKTTIGKIDKGFIPGILPSTLRAS